MTANNHQVSHSTRDIVVNKTMKVVVFMSLVSVVLFTMLMSTYPPVHDFFHGLRHALMIIPCH